MIHKKFNMTGIPERPAKPRQAGLTLMLDKGLAARQVEDVLDAAAEYIDLVKLGWGTAVITPKLERKLEIYQSAGVPVYFGGTLFEAFFIRDQLDTYKRLLASLGLAHVEISDGTLHITHEEKLRCIRSFGEDFIVLSEVGSKDDERIMPPYKWVHLIQAELASGSWKVICEARESGTAGLYRPNGEVRTGLVEEISDLIDSARLVFEAPQKSQQVWFIQHLGTNVNLGNIGPEELIPLETLRLGLRADTLLEFFSTPDFSSLPYGGTPTNGNLADESESK
jgi:phosphosulfolactate synthase